MIPLAQRIREYLADAGPSTPAQVHAAMPDVKRSRIPVAMGAMRRDGILSVDDSYPAKYSLAREVGVWCYANDEEREAAERASREKTNAKRREQGAFKRDVRGRTGPSRAEVTAAAEARKAKRKAATEARRKAKREAQRAEQAQRRPASQQPTVARAFVPKTAPTPKPAMSSEDFIRQGGRVERIPAPWEKAA